VVVDLEMSLVRPNVVVALGATAARSLLGRPVHIETSRGRVLRLGGASLIVTVHPSFLLRLPEAAAKAREFRRLAADLMLANALLLTKGA
jgi:DNA polymerase